MNYKKGLSFLCFDAVSVALPKHLSKTLGYRLLRLTIFSILFSLFIGIIVPYNAAAEATKCGSDDACIKGKICSYGQCIPGCRKTADCNPGQYCIDNQCTSKVCKPGKSWSCYEADGATESVGLCLEGVQFCLSNGRTFSPCFNQVRPQKEICDREDNDCDGSIDEGITCECKPGSKQACYTGPQNTHDVGECRGGLQYCEKDYSWGKCAEQKLPSLEICDRKDNDCDGQVDEDVNCECTPGAIRSCYTHDPATAGIGECHNGKQVCQIDNTWFDDCFEEQGPVNETMADNKDNNCDGEIDNVFVDPNPQILDTPVIIDSEPKPQLEIIE